MAVVPAQAQTGAQCAAIPQDTERLQCYDGLFQPSASGATVASFTLQSDQLIPASPSGRAPAEVTVSCDAGQLGIAFSFAGNTISSLGRDVGVTFQPDLRRARSQTLQVDASNTQVLIQSTEDVIEFIEGLRGVTNLAVRVTPVSTRSLNVRFRVASLLEGATPVLAGCAQ
jgi:type VI secretion system protein VasI